MPSFPDQLANARERLAAQEEALKGHEDTCGARYKAIADSLDALWKRNGRIEMAAWGILIAVVGWLLVNFLAPRVQQPMTFAPTMISQPQAAPPPAPARP